jgi:hypothetical protein
MKSILRFGTGFEFVSGGGFSEFFVMITTWQYQYCTGHGDLQSVSIVFHSSSAEGYSLGPQCAQNVDNFNTIGRSEDY